MTEREASRWGQLLSPSVRDGRSVLTDPPQRMVSGVQAAARLPAVHTSVHAHLESRHVARVIYGAIIGLALIVAVEKHPPGPGTMVAWLLGTGVAVGLAELYSEIVGTETRERHRVTRHQVAPMLEDTVAVAFGVAFPAVFFVVAAVGLVEPSTAFSLAKWSGLGLIGFYGYWAARFAGAPVGRALVQAVLVAMVGGGLIALKALVH